MGLALRPASTVCTMSVMDESPNLDRSAQYLLAEMQTINEKAALYEQIKSARVNVYLAVVGAAGTAFAFVARQLSSPASELLIALVLTVSVLILGLLVLRDMTEYSAAIVYQYRWAGRLRRWFQKDNPAIEKYLPFRAVDDRPRFAENTIFWKSSEAIVRLINAYLGGLSVGLLLSLLLPVNGDVLLTVIGEDLGALL